LLETLIALNLGLLCSDREKKGGIKVGRRSLGEKVESAVRIEW